MNLFVSGLALSYSHLPRLDHVTLEAAFTQVAKPKDHTLHPAFSASLAQQPFNTQGSQPTNKRRKTTDLTDAHAQPSSNPTPTGIQVKLSHTTPISPSFTPSPTPWRKFSTARSNSRMSALADPTAILRNNIFIPPPNLVLSTQDFINASISHNTWKGYSSALCHFQAFEQAAGIRATWPLEIGVIRSYVSHSLSKASLSPKSIPSYLSALRFAHILKGMPAPAYLTDDTIKIIIRGAKNIEDVHKKPNLRRHISIPLLAIIREEIFKSSWHTFLKTSLWTLFSVSFFATARMGELVSPSRTSFDPSSTLRVRDVLDRSDNILIHIRNPKSGNPQGEFLHLYPFPLNDLCPVKAIQELLAASQRMGFPAHLPIFRDNEGLPFTLRYVNLALTALLKDRIDLTSHSLSCHSFRAGIPSELQRSPQLLNSDDVKGWGRWNSDAANRYERLSSFQKKKIFDKISSALLAES